MFENLLYQDAASLLTLDIKNKTLPSSILLSGPQSSGKLTCALELARVLSCTEPLPEKKGNWLCSCPSCRKQKELAGTNVILAGPRDCSLEILAATRTLLDAGANNYSYLPAARYLYIRSVRKLVLRFSPVLWEGDDKLSKLSPLVEEINEQLERLNPEFPVPANEELDEITKKILQSAQKLESTFMYDSLPIDHIRKASFWTRMKSNDGKKVLIIENADKMNESCRNALLKILEEPPEDAVFILTTASRGAVMPTILSRVRTYSFVERTQNQQREVIERVFHDNADKGNCQIQEYLQTFLPVSPKNIKSTAEFFYNGIRENKLIQISEIVKKCEDFEPRTMFKIFLQGILEAQKSPVDKDENSGRNAEVEIKNIQAVRQCFNNVSVYNQKPVAALEKLYRDLAGIRKANLF